jgi:hypothetical protein
MEAAVSDTPRVRECSREKDPVSLAEGSPRICIPIDQDTYERILGDAPAFRQYVDQMISQYPEVFPRAIGAGYWLHDVLPASKKLPAVRLRRIKLTAPAADARTVFTIAPSFVLPYMTGYADEVEKALYLRKFGVPYAALTYVFGRNDDYWYRLENHLGRNSIVGTTVKTPEKLPTDLLADEKHTRLNGAPAYIATTVGDDCILGASVTLSADTDALTQGYTPFQTEARQVDAAYQPKTVNTDGWTPTQQAWQSLFPLITTILCFLHAFLKIQACSKRLQELFPEIQRRVWDAYHASDAATFLAKVADLQTWAKLTLPAGAALEAVLKLCAKAPLYAQAYAYPTAHRTSNMLDRHMDLLDRYLYSMRYFHGDLMAAEYSVRAWALLHNFTPYGTRAQVADQYQSPAHKLNGYTYHANWLQNLQVAASMGGVRA